MSSQNILDIATKNVVKISDKNTINDALNLMHKEDHSVVIVVPSKGKNFSIITANDIIKLKTQEVDFNTKIKKIKFNTITTVFENISISDALYSIDSDTSCLCVVDEKNNLKGFVSYYDLLSSIDPKVMVEKRKISEIILSTHINYANMNTKTSEIINLMNYISADCIVLVDNHDKQKGIITSKDTLKIFGENLDLNVPVHEYMSSPIQTIKSDTKISKALKFIREKHFKRLIAEDQDGNIIGQITQKELIARVYSKWADIMRDNDTHLNKVNKVLKDKARRLEELSVIDNLTGAFNRLKFEKVLESEISKVLRYNTESFCIIFFDIDNFKKINDNFGHLEGDKILQALVKKVQKHLRSSDIFSRWGGEEFVILLPLTSLDNALIAAENIREYISTNDFSEIGKVTCSFGVTKFQKDDTYHSVILRADEAMYKAKTSGKNKVITFDKK